MLLPIASPITVTRALIESGTIKDASGRGTVNAYALASSSRSLATRRATALTVRVTANPSGTTRMVFCTASETPASSVVATNVTGTSPSDVGVNAANVALAKEPARTVTVAGDPTGVDSAASQSFSAVLIWIVAVTS